MLINKQSRKPIYKQVIEQYKRLIVCSAIKPEEKLPSVRSLSQDLGVNPNTLQKAYAELERLGICYSLHGKGRFVSADAKEIIIKDKRQNVDELYKVVVELLLSGMTSEEIIAEVDSSIKKAKDKVEELGE